MGSALVIEGTGEWASGEAKEPRPILEVRGVVEHGDARGRLLGYPTANLALPDTGLVAQLADDVAAVRSWAARTGIQFAAGRPGVAD